jgi:hypothetical protein
VSEPVLSKRPIDRAVRVTTIAAIVCTCLSLAAMFLPSGEVVIKEPMATHRAARSLYELGKSSGSVRSFLATFRTSTAKRFGVKALDRLAPHLSGRMADDAAQLREAVAILDGLQDRDIDRAGTAMAAILWTLISLHVLLVLLLQGTDVGTGRARVIAALVTALLIAALAVGVYVALDRIVGAANAELGRAIFALRTGAFLLPLAALVALSTVIAVVVTHTVARRSWRARQTVAPAA